MPIANYMDDRDSNRRETTDLLFYQSLWRCTKQAEEVLRALYRDTCNTTRPSEKRKLKADAIYEGAWRCKVKADEYVETAHRRGLLLTMFIN